MVEAFEDLGAIALEEVDVVGIQDVGQEGVAEIVALGTTGLDSRKTQILLLVGKFGRLLARQLTTTAPITVL